MMAAWFSRPSYSGYGLPSARWSTSARWAGSSGASPSGATTDHTAASAPKARVAASATAGTEPRRWGRDSVGSGTGDEPTGGPLPAPDRSPASPRTDGGDSSGSEGDKYRGPPCVPPP